MGLALQLVPERLELGRLAPGAMRERLRQQPVCEPGIARQQGPVEVRAEDTAGAAALEAALAVVSEACQHAPERLRAVLEHGAARVVLEARERAPLAGLELALEQDVADHPALAGNGVQR